MRQHFILSRKTDSGSKVYMTAHRRSDESFSGFDVMTDADPRKALMFSSSKNAHDRAKELSCDLETYAVELYTSTAKVGDVVADESGETKVKLAEKA